jgi:hypothetical protein
LLPLLEKDEGAMLQLSSPRSQGRILSQPYKMLALPSIQSHFHRVHSKKLYTTFESGDASTSPHIVKDDCAMVDDSLLFGHSTTSITYERMMDPMLLESHLMAQRHDTEVGSSTPLSSNLNPRLVNHHPSTEDITTPMLLRSEAQQLVGHELIKALDDFK